MPEETPKQTARDRENTAWLLSAQGMNTDDIAAELGYANRSGAWKAVQRAKARHEDRDKNTRRAMIDTVLRDLRLGIMENARNGDLFAFDRVIKSLELEAKLYNLFEPDETDDTTAEARAAILGFKEGLKGLFGSDDMYGQVTDGSTEHVPVDGESGA